MAGGDHSVKVPAVPAQLGALGTANILPNWLQTQSRLTADLECRQCDF